MRKPAKSHTNRRRISLKPGAKPDNLLTACLLPKHHFRCKCFREDEIASGFAAAFARRFLDEKFFYWMPASVSAWVELMRAPAYRNANRALQLLAASDPELVTLWPQADTLCGLGCGEGSKDKLLLQAFQQTDRPLAYTAVDFSQSLLELGLTATRG